MHLFLRDAAARSLTLTLDPALYQTLAQALWLSGQLSPPALCSGLGRCGSCRVRFHEQMPDATDAERTILGETALADGWRLACRHAPQDGMRIELPSLLQHEATPKRQHLIEKTGSSDKVCLAIDLGTTSIHWRAIQHLSGDTWEHIDSGQMLNPQMGAGSDIVSRLALAGQPQGRAQLRLVLVACIQNIVERLPYPVTEMCIAGNTAMTAILLDADCTGLARAPYHIPERGGRSVTLTATKTTLLPPVWIPPQLAPFVGGDISAGMAVLLFASKPIFPFVLADLGTNGEMVLCRDPHTAYITSVPLGPSLEGIGLSCGGIADTGSIDAFQITPKGLQPSVMGGGEPRSICATGYLSLIAALLRLGILDTSGHLATSASHPLAQRILSSITFSAEGWRLPITPSIWLSAIDVEEILKVKAAFSLAFEALLTASDLTSRELAAVILGGSLGEHAPLEALATLGFLPHGIMARTRAAGNTSLEGAAVLLQHPEYRELLIEWSRTCQPVGLTDASDFTSRYMHHMRFSF